MAVDRLAKEKDAIMLNIVRLSPNLGTVSSNLPQYKNGTPSEGQRLRLVEIDAALIPMADNIYAAFSDYAARSWPWNMINVRGFSLADGNGAAKGEGGGGMGEQTGNGTDHNDGDGRGDHTGDGTDDYNGDDRFTREAR
ncbi:hypothetical protein EJ06DRAFT_532182 [Trichodelitschia bisporula]|uniref:Uncharacterized protein n=1 Tax=Trichodelitschia bisporula TaxID=703511 RepID=A0A6G1HR90_9PEZI|nr:hypothetical protein EJ06DRAFT_532182 [Trichodelitschia bisporula]